VLYPISHYQDDLGLGSGLPENELMAAVGGVSRPAGESLRPLVSQLEALGHGAGAFLYTRPPHPALPHAFAFKNLGGTVFWIETQAAAGSRVIPVKGDPPNPPLGARVIVVDKNGRAISPDTFEDIDATTSASTVNALVDPAPTSRYRGQGSVVSPSALAVVEQARNLVRRLRWRGGSEPDRHAGWALSEVTTWGHQNDFARWINRHGDTPNEHSTMGCTEAILFAAYRAGVVTRQWLTQLYEHAANTARNAFVDTWAERDTAWLTALIRGMYRGDLSQYHLDWYQSGIGGPDIPAGNLIFFDGYGHVALSLGARDAQGRQQVLSHLAAPRRFPQGPLDTSTTYGWMQVTSVEELVADAGYSLVEFAAPAWDQDTAGAQNSYPGGWHGEFTPGFSNNLEVRIVNISDAMAAGAASVVGRLQDNIRELIAQGTSNQDLTAALAKLKRTRGLLAAHTNTGTEAAIEDARHAQKDTPKPHIDIDSDGIAWASPHRSAYRPDGAPVPHDLRACVAVTVAIKTTSAPAPSA
jgi:hypothetical protein